MDPLSWESIMARSSEKKSTGKPHPKRAARRGKGPSAPVPAAAAVTSTEAQNNFGNVLTRAIREGMVVITKYGAEAAVVLSMDRFRALVPDQEPDLGALTEEFRRMVARMQTSDAHAASDALFTASPDDLAEAAVLQASHRRPV
jgi:prevent-host-death family protein